MKRRNTLKEVTIKNNFMFGAVMCNPENCKEFLELVLRIPIERIEVSIEKSIVYHPEYKGVRLDVYAKDENHTHYDVEMQTTMKPAIGKRARYYHSQIDMELLVSGEEYEKLPNSYVIFVCDYDPFGKKKYCYTFANQCLEEFELNQKDGCRTIFLSTHGENRDDVPTGMVNFLKFVGADLAESEQDFGDDFVRKLQKAVRYVKESREMEERFMSYSLLFRDERVAGRNEGKAQSIIVLLEDLGTIPDEAYEKIMAETDEEKLHIWLKLAAKADSMEQFLENM